MGHGERAVRVGPITGPGEVRELAAAFDVAHELRTPVAVLQAGHEALLDGVAEPTPGELTSLRDEVLRLTRMLADLQDLAAAAALHGYGVTPDRLRPITPDRISPIDTSFVADTASPRNTMPTVAAPAAPIPVHTA